MVFDGYLFGQLFEHKYNLFWLVGLDEIVKRKTNSSNFLALNKWEITLRFSMTSDF